MSDQHPFAVDGVDGSEGPAELNPAALGGAPATSQVVAQTPNTHVLGDDAIDPTIQQGFLATQNAGHGLYAGLDGPAAYGADRQGRYTLEPHPDAPPASLLTPQQMQSLLFSFESGAMERDRLQKQERDKRNARTPGDKKRASTYSGAETDAVKDGEVVNATEAAGASGAATNV